MSAVSATAKKKDIDIATHYICQGEVCALSIMHNNGKKRGGRGWQKGEEERGKKRRGKGKGEGKKEGVKERGCNGK